MTLRRRLILHIGLTAFAATALAAGVLFAVNGLRQDFGVAMQANQQLRRVYEVGLHVSAAKRWLGQEPASAGQAKDEIQAAQLKLDHRDGAERMDGNSPETGTVSNAGGWVEGSDADVERVRTALHEAAEHLAGVRDATGMTPFSIPAIDRALAAIASLSAKTRTTLAARQQSADAKHHATRVIVAGLSLGVIASVVVAGFYLYRTVMTPLDRLRLTAQRIAGGLRSERASIVGNDEWTWLGRDFNRMADELDGLCASLERQVADKSKELVRSERLASVGYLAAGVAHEINNPLGIIAGYGERSLQHLRKGLTVDTTNRVEKAIEVMCDEAFRCKGITDRLLSLARPGTETAEPVCLKAVADDVISNVGALGDFAGRRITLEAHADAAGSLRVLGRDAELKQVVLNLVVNALQAIDPHSGQVWVTIRRVDDDIELAVRDNGTGMSASLLERVFEPFFSERRGQQPRGTGLGLSITHAIVADHGGTLRAHSDGIGKGSRFVVRLPGATG